MLKYTEGKWEVTKWSSHKHLHISANDHGPALTFVCNLGNINEADGLPYNPNSTNNANLICAAVNACTKINYSNPLAVAKAIPLMYEALKGFERAFKNHDIMAKGWPAQMDMGDAIEKARESISQSENMEDE